MIEAHWYQSDCLKAIARARRQGRERILYTMASGAGKTITAGLDALAFRKEYPEARTLFLCHQNRILDHARSEFEAIHGSQYSYGFYTGEQKTKYATQFLFASFQTMRKCHRRFRPDEFDYVLVDESHHTYAETYLDVAEYWRPKTMVGMTATPDRTDGQDIRRFFGKEVFSLPLDEALVHDILTPVDYRLLSDEIQLTQILDGVTERWSISKLNRTIFVPKRDEEIARIINTHADKVSNPRIIVFCESVPHCDHFAKYLQGSMPYHSKISSNERMIRLEMFRAGMIRALVTRDIFNEGIDIPQANIIVFLRSTKSALIFLQQLGRGLRKSDGKDKVTVLDFVGNCERIKMVHDLWALVQRKRRELVEKTSEGARRGSVSELEPMMLNVNTVEFQERILKVLDILGQRDFYPTLQEAQDVARTLGITTRDEYAERYKEDPKLPSGPWDSYRVSWKGWTAFLGKKKYKTLRQASAAAKRLGVTTSTEYRERYTENLRLRRNPNEEYPDEWEDWGVFLGTGSGTVKDPYPTWQEASDAAIRLSITSKEEYVVRRKEDQRLPGAPPQQYADFPGWGSFLKTGNKAPRHIDAYPTWQEAARVVQALGITSTQYPRRYQEDPRLPWNPWERYKDFPGWDTFLGRT